MTAAADLPSKIECLDSMAASVERAAMARGTSQRATGSDHADPRLDIDYNPDTHFAVCKQNTVVIKRRSDCKVDNPRDFAVARLDRNGGFTYRAAIEGDLGETTTIGKRDDKPDFQNFRPKSKTPDAMPLKAVFA